MTRIIAFVLAFGISAGAWAAEPVETAISDWVAAISAQPGWSARYETLTYDQGTDTAVLSGLTVNHAATKFAITFEPISVVGYVEGANGTFGAKSVTMGGASVNAEKSSFTIADLQLDGLGNVPKKLGVGVTWDPQKPFTSAIRAYAPLVDIRLDHGAVGSMAVVDRRGPVPTLTDYHNLTVDRWADGKIASMIVGSAKVRAELPEGPFTMSMGRVEVRDTDYAAVWHVYDPDQYVGGVGDKVWRSAVGSVIYDKMVFEAAGGKFSVGSTIVEGIKFRQPERSIAPFLDAAMLNPDPKREPTPEELRSIFGFASAFSVGKMAMRDIDFAGTDGSHGELGSMTFTDFSMEGLGEFAMEGIKVTGKDAGSAEIGRIALGGLVYPDFATLVELGEAEKAGQPIDYSKIKAELGFVEALDLEVAVPGKPRIELGKGRLDLGNYIGMIPTLAALDITDLEVPAAAIEDPTTRAMWQGLGYDKVEMDTIVKLAWKEEDGSVVIDDLKIDVADVGTLSLNAVLGKLDRAAFEQPDKLSAALEKLAFVNGTLTFKDSSLTNRVIDMQAAATGADPEAFRRQVAASLPALITGVGSDGFQEKLRQVLELFVMKPGSIRATAAPSAPVPLIVLAALAQTAPANLPDLLALTVETVAP